MTYLWSKNRLKLLNNNKLEDIWLNKEHHCWFSFQTLTQFLEKKGFSEVNYSYENLNPDLISLNDKNKFIIPSTAGYYCAIPLTTASGITGFVEFDSEFFVVDCNFEP